MSELQKSIRDALDKLAETHGITPNDASTGPVVRRLAPVYTTTRRTTVIDTAGRVEREDTERRRAAASSDERSAEGSYAEVEIARGVIVTVFVLTVERTGFGTKATCKRLDTRQTCRVRLDELTNVRSTE